VADITTTRIFSDGEKGITATKMNDIIASSAIQPAFVSAKPVASSTVAGDQLLLLTAAGSYARIDSSVFASAMVPLLPAPEPKIWDVRLRSFNAVGNPNFEVDQRNCGTSVGMIGPGPQIDRWASTKAAGATMGGAVQQMLGNPPLPGTNFVVSSKFWRVTLTTQQTTLAAGDYHNLNQQVEGPRWRELMSDVHSVSLMVRSSVANLSFGLSLRDSPATKSLTKLCTIPTANTWTLISLPNLPIWPSANFVYTPGSVGYQFAIALAAGSTFMSPANDTWQTGNFIGAVGQSNFAAQAVNSTFDIAFVQHEPSAQCSTLMDVPFNQNLDSCQRYFSKSYSYAVKPGSITGSSLALTNGAASAAFQGIVPFKKSMAKVPTSILVYSYATGAVNNVRILGVDVAVNSAGTPDENAFSTINVSPSQAANSWAYFHYTADTGW
jgi:hypothetical protein